MRRQPLFERLCRRAVFVLKQARCPLWVINRHHAVLRAMSALPPTADINRRNRNVRYVPEAAVSNCSRAAPHSITSSARASTDVGTSRASAFAVLRLITSWYLVGACTGRSPGLSPLRMRSTYWAAFRYWST
jgi:hypothetical protein